MNEKTENLVLEHLRHIRDQVDRTAEDMLEVKQRIGRLEQEVAGLHSDFANLSVRMDRVDARLERVERRLELTPAE